jgi:cell division septal protein FtsQ
MLQDLLSEKQKKKKKKRRDFLLVTVAVVVVIVIVFVWWALFRSPLLQVRQIVVRGNDTIASSDVTALLDAKVQGEHGFVRSLFGAGNMLAWPDALASSDLAVDPRIADVTLSKNYWSHTITVTVTERKPFAIWCDMPKADANGNPAGDEACFWFDTSGVMFETAFDTQGSALFAIHDYSESNAALGGKILPDIFILNLISILNVLKQSGLTIKEVALQDIGLQEIDISTYNGPDVYFSLRFPANEDLPVLQNLITQPGFSSLQYVDFRVENRAYYK